MKFLLGFILSIIVLGSIVPMVQFVCYLFHREQSNTKSYYFSKELFDFDLDSLKFENNSQQQYSRLDLGDRGWVRCPNGTIITNEMFDQQKKDEYSIELP